MSETPSAPPSAPAAPNAGDTLRALLDAGTKTPDAAGAPRPPALPDRNSAYWNRDDPNHPAEVEAYLQRNLAHQGEALPSDLAPPPPRLTIPETVIADPADRAGLEALAPKLGFDALTSQGFIDHLSGFREDPPLRLPPPKFTEERGLAAAVAQWGEEETAERLALARDVYGTLSDEAKAFWREGYGNDPEAVAYFAKIGARQAFETVRNATVEQRRKWWRWSRE